MRKKLIAQYFDKSQKLQLDNKEYVNQFMTLFQWFLVADMVEDDISTKLILDKGPAKEIKAKIIVKEKGILAGMAEAIFFLRNKSKIKIIDFKKDGSSVNPKEVILVVSGDANEILAFERTILNILARMSGIATMTHQLVTKYTLSNGPFLAATRKTPWMWLDKKAVSVGGGLTHRLSLSDGILIKDNHWKLLSKGQLKNLRYRLLEIEVGSQNEAISLAQSYSGEKNTNPLILMLDNFTPTSAKKTIFEIRKIEKKIGKFIIIELSGGISKKNLGVFSRLGADVISLGELTHSAKTLDLSLSITN